jgi:hypothetical protein
MKHQVASSGFCAILIFSVLMTSAEAAPPTSSPSPAPTLTPKTQTRVKLFTQDCLLIGPFSEAVLQSIHSISPEKMPQKETLLPNGEAARKFLETVKKASGLPPGLDRYRERLAKRLEAWVAFFNGLKPAGTPLKPDALLTSAKGSIQGPSGQQFEALARKLAKTEKGAAWSSASMEQLLAAYDLAIEPDPQEEFHRAIGKMDVRYNCSFDENEPERPASG